MNKSNIRKCITWIEDVLDAELAGCLEVKEKHADPSKFSDTLERVYKLLHCRQILKEIYEE